MVLLNNSILFCFLVFLSEAVGQSLNVSRTHPIGVDGANPLVLAVEDSKNVTLLCEVVENGETSISTEWRWISDPESNPNGTILFFHANGTGCEENFMSLNPDNESSNLTILTFNGTFDNKKIGCGHNGTILIRFDLKLISKYCYKVINFCFLIRKHMGYIFFQWSMQFRV